MAGAVPIADALAARVLRPTVAGAAKLPAWLRWGAVTAGALCLAGALAPASRPRPVAAPHRTFDASAWLGLTEPVFRAPAPMTVPGARAPLTAPVVSSLPVACTPGANLHAISPARTGTAPGVRVAPAAEVVTAPVGAVLTGSTSSTTDPISSTLAGVGNLLNGLTAGGAGTSSTGSPTSGLNSIIQSLTPTTTSSTTTTTAPAGTGGTGTDHGAGTTSGAGTGAPGPTPPVASVPAPAPLSSAPGPVSTDIGCELIGAGSVGTVAPGETPAQASAVATALSLLGTPYVWGGESKRGFDCSGLVQYSFATAGIALPASPRTSTRPGRWWPRGRSWSPATSCSSAPDRETSTTWACSWATA